MKFSYYIYNNDKEYDVFRVYFSSVYDRIKNNPKIKNTSFDEDTKIALSSNLNVNIDKVYKKVLKEYCQDLMSHLTSQF